MEDIWGTQHDPKYVDSFLKKIKKTDTCWVWTGSMSLVDSGYPRLWIGKRVINAHRFSWELFNNQPVPKGMFVKRICNNHRCVNPEHLWLDSARAKDHRQNETKSLLANIDSYNKRDFISMLKQFIDEGGDKT